MTRYDIVVAGGGAVGATLACALADTGERVLLADPWAEAAVAPPAFAPRPLALSLASQRVLASLGVWDEIAPDAAPIASIHVSEAGRFGAARLDAGECGIERFGSVVAAGALGAALRDAVARRSAIHRAAGRIVDATVSADPVASCVMEEAPDTHGTPAKHDTQPTQTMPDRSDMRERPDREDTRDTWERPSREDTRDTGDARDTPCTVEASLLVVADGGRSALRDALGFGTTVRDYRQSAIASVVEAQAPCAHTAFERFTSGGPVALLPMGGARYGLVWSCDEMRAQELADLSEPEFAEALDGVFAGRLGGLAPVGARGVFPLRLVRARAIVSERVVLVGNAANHLHPVAGQGFNLGMRDVACLAEVVATARREGNSPGDAAVLERYRRWRAPDHAAVARFTDMLVDLFGHRCSPVASLRAPALVALDLVPVLKRVLARRAMGLAGRVPRLGLGLRP